MLDDTPTNDNELHQVVCNNFKIDYFREMGIIITLRNRLERKINYTLPNKINITKQGLATSGENLRSKRTIIQDVAAIGGMMIKRINALVDAKRASSFNNVIKLVNENVQITHDRLITLENRRAMMAKAIIPVLKDFKAQINNTNDRLIAQYQMMTIAHDRYNRLFRQTHKTFQIHHLALLMFRDYITILVGTLQRIHRQYIRYKLALDDTLIGIENLNSGYLTHRILDPKILGKYLEAVKDDLEETASEFEPMFTSVYQYYGNSWTIACKDVSQVFEIEYTTYHILNRSELCKCSLTTGNYLLSYTNINCGNAPEARDGCFTTYYSFNKIVLDIITEKFDIQVDENTRTQAALLHDDIPGYDLPTIDFVQTPKDDDEDVSILEEENPQIYVHLDNVLVHIIDKQEAAIFKSKQDFNQNKERISEYIKYAENWQVISVICSYTAMACDIILIVAMIVFLLKYRKTMQAMLAACSFYTNKH